MKDYNRLLFVGLISASLWSTAALAETTNYDAPVSMDLNFIFHIDDGMAEQDVFFEREAGSGQIYRPTKATRDMDAPLFAPDQPVAHTPLQTDNIGPWNKGKSLGITLGQWFAAQGKATYRCTDGEGHLHATFTKLVPNGVYTMWHDFFVWPPTKPFIGTYDLPLGARDGSENTFRTDAHGNAVFDHTFKPCLQLSGEQLLSELAIAWHSDDQSHGHEPGEFSTKTHVHMFVVLPQRVGI